MFENALPKLKIGCLRPGAILDNAAYEAYRILPERVMMVMISVGFNEFSVREVERVFAPIDKLLDQLKDAEVHIVVQSGVPLPVLIGIEAHDRLIEHIAAYTAVPATSTVLAVVRSAAEIGIKNIALVNKWTPAMNETLAAFFAREGVDVCGTATRSLDPADFRKIPSKDSMELAYELGRRAFTDNPDCDGVYIGGGSWIAEPVAVQLEAEFGRPVLCNQSSVIRHTLNMLDDWAPIKGFSRLLALA